MSRTVKEIFAKKLRCENISEEEKQILNRSLRANSEIGELVPVEIMEEIEEKAKNKFRLKNHVKSIFVLTEKGGANFSEDAKEILEIFGRDEMDSIAEEEVQHLKGIRWELSQYGKIFNISNVLIKDYGQCYKYFLERISEILVNTENKIIYNKILEQPKHVIEIVKESSPTSIRIDLKEFFKKIVSDEVEKNVYMSLNLLDELSFISDMNGKLLITDNPLVPNGKLLCGKPIIVIPNDIFTSVNGKEILVYGDLKKSIVLFEEEDKGIFSTQEAKKAWEYNLTQTRVVGRYDIAVISENNFIVAEMNLNPSIPV